MYGRGTRARNAHYRDQLCRLLSRRVRVAALARVDLCAARAIARRFGVPDCSAGGPPGARAPAARRRMRATGARTPA